MSAEKAYLLRTVAADMTSYGGFVWPTEGPVEAPDWDPTPECGGGLHGLLWGEGDGWLLNWSEDANWLVVEVDVADVVALDGKVKVPRGVVVHCGSRQSATSHIVARGARGAPVPRIRWWGGKRYRLCVGYVGEDGIEANVAYKVVDGKLTEVPDAS